VAWPARSYWPYGAYRAMWILRETVVVGLVGARRWVPGQPLGVEASVSFAARADCP